MKTQDASCPQCGGLASLKFVPEDFNQWTTKERFRYLACSKCALVFLETVPENLGRYYPKGYHAIPRVVSDLDGSLDAERHKVELVQRFSSGLRLLEIGPSFGAFSLLAKRSGFDVAAVELDSDCCKFLREAVGIEVHEESDVPKFLDSGEKFDAICLWHSLEHMPDPWAVMDRIRGALHTGGSLFVATPNPDSLQFKLFGRYWLHLDAPRHVQLIPFEVLKRRQERNGFRLEYVTTNDRAARDCNVAGWRVSMNYMLRVAKRNRVGQRIGRGLGWLLKSWERREGRGSAYTAVFRLKADP